MGKAIGIDLGTTNSVACYFDGGEPTVLLNTYHEQLTPSVVAFQKLDEEEEGETVVGQPAVSQARLFPKDTIYSIKRLMGRRFSQDKVQEWKKRVSYEIVESEEPVKGLAAVRMGGKVHLPADISALILEHIKKYSERVLGEEVTHAVVTVPAYFGEPERAATRDAGQKAGLVVKTLLPEPTAAALAFGAQPSSQEGFVLVYDLGGGTFDISILSMVGLKEGTPDYNVMAISGDHFLGGDDFDIFIVDRILKQVQEKYGMDLSEDWQFRIVAKAEAKKAKEILSAEPTAVIYNPQAVQREGKDIAISLKLTQEDFRKQIASDVVRAKNLVVEILKEQSLRPEDITDVLLVGGTTQIPLVAESMEELFGKGKVRRTVNPMHCVAMGAGILAHRMKGIQCPNEKCKRICDEAESKCPSCGSSLAVAAAAIEGMSVTEITANNFGVQAVIGSNAHAFEVLVEKGTPLPMKEPRTKILYTTEEGQDLIRVPVFEGLGSNVLQNVQIGTVEYGLPLQLPINTEVRVSFQLDRNSVVKVTVEVVGHESETRHEQELARKYVDEVFAPAEEEEEEELLAGEDEAIDDAERNLVVLERYIGRAEAFKGEYARVLSAGQQRKLDKAIEEARRVYDEDQGEKAMDAIVKIDRVLQTSGTASLIDQAKLAASTADETKAAKLTQLADQLKEHAEQGNNAMLARLSGPAAELIRQVFTQQREAEYVPTAQSFGGLLGAEKRQRR